MGAEFVGRQSVEWKDPMIFMVQVHRKQAGL